MATVTQGLSSQITKSLHSDWRVVVLNRLIGQYSVIPTSASTSAAEKGLGIAPSAYWFLSRVDNLYGRVLMVWTAKGSVSPNSRLSPFDTGGIWHDHLEADPPFSSPSDKAAFVSQYTMVPADGFPVFSEWLSTAFAGPHEYVAAAASEPYYIIHERLASCKSAFAWSWELRTPKSDLPSSDLALKAVFWERSDYLDFRNYVRVNSDDQLFAAVTTLLSTVSHVYENLNQATQEARRYVVEQPA